METEFRPSQEFKKKFMMWLVLGEATVIILLLKSFIQNYSITTSLVLIFALIISIFIFNRYISQKISLEYLSFKEDGMEYNGECFLWDEIREIRIKKEDDNPMFLIVRVQEDYIKIPLRMFQSNIDNIKEEIKKAGHEIVE